MEENTVCLSIKHDRKEELMEDQSGSSKKSPDPEGLSEVLTQ